MVTRIAVVPGPDGVPLTLISTLSSHTAALDANPACSLLLGEPGPKGDPLTHPRLTLQAVAEAQDKAALKDHYLGHYPKARLYYDFGDFRLIRLEPGRGVPQWRVRQGLSADRRGPGAALTPTSAACPPRP
jgi:putative heme iron utilization protein